MSAEKRLGTHLLTPISGPERNIVATVVRIAAINTIGVSISIVCFFDSL